jgi:YggT family protein
MSSLRADGTAARVAAISRQSPPGVPMYPVAWLLYNIISIYIYILIAYVVMSWLIAFNVVNMRHPFVNAVARFLHQVTAPVLRPIQRVVPSIGGVDISPIILALILGFLEQMVLRYVRF